MFHFFVPFFLESFGSDLLDSEDIVRSQRMSPTRGRKREREVPRKRRSDSSSSGHSHRRRTPDRSRSSERDASSGELQFSGPGSEASDRRSVSRSPRRSTVSPERSPPRKRELPRCPKRLVVGSFTFEFVNSRDEFWGATSVVPPPPRVTKPAERPRVELSRAALDRFAAAAAGKTLQKDQRASLVQDLPLVK